MALYRIELRPSAARELAALPRDVQRRIARLIDRMQQNPRPPGAKMLEGPGRLMRLRVGDYRAVYVVHDAARVVEVVRLAKRDTVYRGL